MTRWPSFFALLSALHVTEVSPPTGFPWTNRLMARFTFAVRPSAKARITTQWIAPPRSGIRRGQQSRSNAPGITATLGVTRGFGRGGWRCILRVNGETVAVARTTL